MKLPQLVKAGRAIRLLGWVGLVFTGIYWLGLFVSNLHKGHPEHMLPVLFFNALITTALSAFYIFAGMALMKRKSWSRYAGIAIGVFMLILFPIGTLLGVYILWCVIKGWHEVPKQS